LLRHRDATRLRVTVEGLLKSVADDGRIHTTYEQTIAATGPAVLEGPQPAEHPDPHRRGPPDPRDPSSWVRGYESLMSVDYSQIEMRIMAHLSVTPG
jgi:DNA polymerase-1